MTGADDDRRFGAAFAMLQEGRCGAIFTKYPEHAMRVLERFCKQHEALTGVIFQRAKARTFWGISPSVQCASLLVLSLADIEHRTRRIQLDDFCIDPDSGPAPEAWEILYAAVQRTPQHRRANDFMNRMRALRGKLPTL